MQILLLLRRSFLAVIGKQRWRSIFRACELITHLELFAVTKTLTDVLAFITFRHSIRILILRMHLTLWIDRTYEPFAVHFESKIKGERENYKACSKINREKRPKEIMQAWRRTRKSSEALCTRAGDEVIVFEISMSKERDIYTWQYRIRGLFNRQWIIKQAVPSFWHTLTARVRNSGTAQVAPEQEKDPHRHSKFFFRGETSRQQYRICIVLVWVSRSLSARITMDAKWGKLWVLTRPNMPVSNKKRWLCGHTDARAGRRRMHTFMAPPKYFGAASNLFPSAWGGLIIKFKNSASMQIFIFMLPRMARFRRYRISFSYISVY